MKFYLVLTIISIKSSSNEGEALSAEAQSEWALYPEDLESRSSSPIQTLESLIDDFEEDDLVQLKIEHTKLMTKELLKNKYTEFNEDYDEPVLFSQKTEFNISEYPWLEKLQKLFILGKKIRFASDELQSFLTKNVWLKELLFLININNKNDVSPQNIKIENAQNSNLPAFFSSQNNTNDSRLNNSVDRPLNQLASPKNLDTRMVFDKQQGSLKASTPSTKNGANNFSSQKPNPDSSNIQIFFESSTTQPESGEHTHLSQNSSIGLDTTQKHSKQLQHNVLSVDIEQPFNKQDQNFGINTNSAELSEKAIENLKNDLLSQRPQILTDKITDYLGAPITQNAVKKSEIGDFESKPDKTPRLSKTNAEVQGDKSRRANSFKAENETSTYRKNNDPGKVKDKKKVKKNKKKSKSKKRHKKKVDNQKATETKKKSKRHSKQKKKVAAVKKQDEHDTLNLKMGDDPNIYSLFENIYDLNTSKHLDGVAKNVSPKYFRYPPAMEKKFILDNNMLNFEEDKRLKTLEPYNVFYKSNYSSPLDDTEAQKSTQNNYVKPQYGKTKVVDRRFLHDKNSLHETASQDFNIRPVGSAFHDDKSSAVDTEHKLVFYDGNQLQFDKSSQKIAFQNQLILKFTVRRKRL